MTVLASTFSDGIASTYIYTHLKKKMAVVLSNQCLNNKKL